MYYPYIDSNGFVSKYFTFNEMTTTGHIAFQELNREAAMASELILKNINRTAEVLDWIVDNYGVQIQITSGYRYDKLNRRVGGSMLSWHKRMDTRKARGAVDFIAKRPGMTWGQSTIWLFHQLRNDKEFRRMIHKTIYYPQQNFMHLSLPTGLLDGKFYMKSKFKTQEVF